MDTIYVVTGSTGEYSDRTDWMVRAFASEAEARAMVERLAAWCDVHGVGENSRGHIQYMRRFECPLDPGFLVDYTGTRYTYAAVPFGG